LTRKKGHNERNARPGNKNGAKGPRVGRKDKTTEPPLPQPRPEAKLPRRRQRAKTGGRDFREGQNSHSVEPFQRGPDLIPRGNGTLLLKIVYHDFRKRIYDSPGKLVGTPAGALAFMDRCIDRRQGRPSRVGQAQPGPAPKFVLMTRDGQEMELPPKPASSPGGPTEAAVVVSAEDALILRHTAPVRPA
jgi:hypothetical protein